MPRAKRRQGIVKGILYKIYYFILLFKIGQHLTGFSIVKCKCLYLTFFKAEFVLHVNSYSKKQGMTFLSAQVKEKCNITLELLNC